jgi:hypothetical protein
VTAPAAAIATHDANGKPIRLYRLPDPLTGDTIELPNISSVLDVLQAWGLTDWKLRMAAVGIVHRADIAATIAAGSAMPGGRDRNRTILDAVSLAIDEGQVRDPDRGYLANDHGSAIHLLTEQIDAGHIEDVLSLPATVAEHAARYVDLMTSHGLEIVESEFTVMGTTIMGEPNYAGTGDRIVRLPGYDGCLVLDIKTGKVKANAAMQLAALANAGCIFDADTGQHRPLPDDLRRDIGLLLHLTAETAELIPVDIKQAWPAFCGALAVKTFCDTKPLHPPLAPGQAAPLADQLAASIEAADDTPPKVVDLMQALSDSIDAAKACRAEKRAAENAEATDLLDAMTETPTGVPAADAYTEPVHIADTLKLAIAAIPDDPDAGTITDDGHVLPDLAARTAWLAGRLAELIDTHGDTIPLAWPDGVPTFKQEREAGVLHTAEQLEQIDRAITDVENELRHPWPNPDPGIVANQRVAADDPRVIDITERFAALPPDIRDDVAAKVAAAGVRRFTIGEGTEQCVATWQRLLHAAEIEAGEVQARANNAAAVLIDTGVDPSYLLVLVGNHTAATAWQADRLDELADALGLGWFTVDGPGAREGQIYLNSDGSKRLETEFGGKGGVRKAARMTADLWGIEPPSKADDVYANPLLAACLCMSESEPPPSRRRTRRPEQPTRTPTRRTPTAP